MLKLLREKQRKVEEAEVSQKSILERRKGSTMMEKGMGSATRIIPRRNIQHLENLV